MAVAALEPKSKRLPFTEIAEFAKFARFAKLVVGAPVRLLFAFNKIAMESGLRFQNWKQATHGLEPLGKVGIERLR